MTTHVGTNGAVKIGANTIAELISWNVDETAALVDDTAATDTAHTFKAGRTQATGEIVVHWDFADTNVQEAMTVGAAVTLELYADGVAAGSRKGTVAVIITSVQVNYPGDDETVRRTFGFQASGAITWATV